MNYKGDIMEFIKRMKTREFIEMGLKTLASVLAGLIVIILMEAMIYSIYMKKINENTSISGDATKASYYITEVGNDKYDIYKYMYSMEDGKKVNEQWARTGNYHNISKAKLDDLLREKGFLCGYNADLYKVVATEISTTSQTTYEKSGDQSPEAQILANKETLQEGYTFTVYVRATATDSYDETSPKFANLTFDELNAKFAKAGDLKEYSTVKIYWRKPNCFDIYMSALHYVIMVIFELAICGFYAWRFVLINKEYKKIEKRFNKTGKVFA